MTDLTKTDQKNFLGIPIIGEGSAGSSRVAQITKEEFAALVKPLLDHPDVHLFGWKQYTPYFNDGDVCEFSACGFYLITKADAEQHEDLKENDPYMVEEVFSPDSDHPTLGGRPWNWDDTTRKGSYGDYEGPDKALYESAMELSGAINNGSADAVLLGLFGDHCRIEVTKDKIEVEEYSHD
ncbi:hypothetical protein [Streptomyces sp. RTd22]|uniref:hypothetical protein n=1 Tax=Streptomyces sp. RTd22 TaxID=1841249 RepID=UPI0007C4B3E3|nr:hypothetical protein [Streptomyces sp. RTd22]